MSESPLTSVVNRFFDLRYIWSRYGLNQPNKYICDKIQVPNHRYISSVPQQRACWTSKTAMFCVKNINQFKHVLQAIKYYIWYMTNLDCRQIYERCHHFQSAHCVASVSLLWSSALQLCTTLTKRSFPTIISRCPRSRSCSKPTPWMLFPRHACSKLYQSQVLLFSIQESNQHWWKR